MERLRKLLHGKTAGNIAVLILALIGAYFFLYREMRFFRIPSTSMEPTLHPVDQIVTLAEGTYHRGDIVVLRETDGSGDYFVKRIVGIPGDKITIMGGVLNINGSYASEPYIAEPINYEIREPVEVPAGSVFVLGDNRNNSSDSHDALESFSTDIIVGRVRYIYYPYGRMGGVPSYPLTSVGDEKARVATVAAPGVQ